MIFSSEIRSDWSIKRFNESSFEFWDRSAWPIAGVIRTWVNTWVVPFEDDMDFISKFRSKQDKQHDAATMELLIYQLLSNSGINLERMARGAGKTPDFLIDLGDRGAVYVECTLAANALQSEEERKKLQAVTQWLEEIPDFPFYIRVVVDQVSDESISKRQLLSFLGGFKPPFTFEGDILETVYSGQGWALDITLIKKTIISDVRTFGTIKSMAKSVDNYGALYSALKGKRASRYDLGEQPYIICVGVDDMTANEEEFFQVLYGAHNLSSINFIWNSEGFFLFHKEPLNTGVSAVLFCKNIKLSGLAFMELSLWHNPFARYPVLDMGWPVREIRYMRQNDLLVREDLGSGRSAFDILRVDGALYLEYLKFEYRKKPKSLGQESE